MPPEFVHNDHNQPHSHGWPRPSDAGNDAPQSQDADYGSTALDETGEAITAVDRGASHPEPPEVCPTHLPPLSNIPTANRPAILWSFTLINHDPRDGRLMVHQQHYNIDNSASCGGWVGGQPDPGSHRHVDRRRPPACMAHAAVAEAAVRVARHAFPGGFCKSPAMTALCPVHTSMCRRSLRRRQVAEPWLSTNLPAPASHT